MRRIPPGTLVRAASALAIAGGAAGPAAAQLLYDAPTVVIPTEPPLTTARSVFTRDRGTPVAERMLPQFSAQGIRVGAFDVFPGLSVGSIFTSNVFADDDRKRSDIAAVIRPEVTVRTSAGPYRIAAYGRGDLRRYAGHGSENTEEGLAGLQGSVAVGPLSSLSAGVGYGSLIEPRFSASSPGNAAKPLEYDQVDGYVAGAFEGAATRLIVRADAARLRYRDTPSLDGGRLFTRDRDRTRYQGTVRLERSLSPAVSLYAAGTVNRVDYRFPTTGGSRDSKGYGAFVGSSFELSALARGDVRVGYIRQKFDQAGTRPISGLGAFGTLLVFPNRLWTLTAHAESTVADSGVPGSGGFLHRGGSVRADYELRRYLVVSGEGGYYRDTYRGLDRRDRLPFADVSATYLSRNHWNARLGYRYLRRSTSGTAGTTEFGDHRVSATLTFQI